MLTKSVGLFRKVLGLRAVCLYDGTNAELHSDGDSRTGLADRTRGAYIAQQDNDEAVSGVFIRSLRAAGNTLGAIGFEGLRDAELTAGPLAELAAAVLERARIFRDASQPTLPPRRRFSAVQSWMPWPTNSRLPWRRS